MQSWRIVASGIVAAVSTPAVAADQLKFGPPPAWVVPNSIPAAAPPANDSPIAVLLSDEQMFAEHGKLTIYAETALKIQTAQGLAVGNLSLPWDPARDTLTVHKLLIRRGDKIIDVLAAGQTFSTMRRESNLEAAMIDGQLTANIQPEGLQEGDILHLATSIERRDPVLKDHVENSFADWNGSDVKKARARLTWPNSMKLDVRVPSSLPARRSTKAGLTTLEVAVDNLAPVAGPRGAPLRFQVGRFAEATSFRSWAEVAELMLPLYQRAAVIAPTGPLRSEVERIKSAATDPTVRAEMALQLVQDRLRYVALLMGEGGYVPADAETSWSRRFGDCKAKTALLLAVLHELGIDAEAALVNAGAGDLIGDRLPALGLFNHVLVRARIGGSTYWLDGTRAGDNRLADIAVPNFRWALPIARGAGLVPLIPGAPTKADTHTSISIDASSGIYAPAPFKVETIVRGDPGRELQAALAPMPSAQTNEWLRAYWRESYDYVDVKSSSYSFNKDTAEMRLVMEGEAKLDWDGGYLAVPASTLAFDPKFERTPGPDSDAPWALEFPSYTVAKVSIKMPAGFAAGGKATPTSVKETLAGVEYARSFSMAGDLFRLDLSERTLQPEVSHKEAVAAAPRLKTIHDEDVYLRVPASYAPTPADIQARLADKPGSASAFLERGILMLNSGKQDEAIADFSEGLKLKPNDAWMLANRGLARAWKGDVPGAGADLTAAEAVDADNPVAARGRGMLAQLRRDHKGAVEAYSKSLQAEPRNGFALSQRAIEYYALGEDAKALSDIEQFLKSGDRNPEVRLVRANIFRKRGDRQAALREADAAAKDHPESDYAQVIAARIYAAFGMQQQAMRAFDAALAIKPNALIYLNRAEARPAADRTGRMADVNEALKLEPEMPEAILFKASLLNKSGRKVEAAQLYKRLGPSASEEPRVRRERAVLLHKMGRTQESEAAFAALRREAKGAADFNELCWAKATADILLESALSDCRKALSMTPDSGPYLDSLGMVLMRLGRLDEALAAYDKAVAADTGAAALMGRAIVHARRGDTARADNDARAARALYLGIDEMYAEYGLRIDAENKARLEKTSASARP